MGVSALAGPLGAGGFATAGGFGAAGLATAALPAAILGEPFFAAKAQYDAQKEWRQEAYRMTAKSVREALFRQYGDLGLRGIQEAQSAGFSIHQIAVESMLGAAAVSAGAASSGVSGASAAAAIDAFRRSEAMRKEAVKQNLEISAENRARIGQGLQARAYQQIVSAVGAPINTPDYIGMGLNAIKSVAGLVGGIPGAGGGGAAAGAGGEAASAYQGAPGSAPLDYSEELSKAGGYA